MSDRKDLPSVGANNYDQRVRETLQTYLGRQGDPLDRGLTLRDLIENGIIKLPDGWTLRPGSGSVPLLPGDNISGSDEVDLTPPPTPTGLAATAAISNFIVQHDAPTYTVGGGHLRTRLYGATRAAGAPAPVFADATEIAQFTGQIYAYSTNPATTWHLWAKWESVAGVLSVSPAGGTNGVVVTTGQDVTTLLTALTGQITQGQLFSSLSSRINLIDGPISLAGSVAQRLYEETQARLAADTTLGSSITTLQSSDDTQASQITTLQTRATTAESNIINLQSTTASQATTITSLTSRTSTAESNIIDLQSTTAGQAASITSLTSAVDLKSRVFFQTTAPASTGSYTLKTGDVWYDTDDGNKSYRWDGSAWVVFVNAAKVYYQAVAPVNTGASPLFVGDLWYDSDDNNHPYRWNGSAWASMRDGYVDARVTTLEQTKIGYAKLNSTGLVFDNNGTITDKAGVDAWNLANPGNQATWYAGLPFATAVKQVSLSDGVSSLTLEQRFTAQKDTNNSLLGQYTVKIDNAGLISGFGLASTSGNASPSSEFGVLASTFWISPPAVAQSTAPTSNLYLGYVWLDTSVSPNVRRYYNGTSWVTTPTRLPFIVQTTATTINGVSVPAGVYIDTAFVRDGTITNAKIGNAAIDDAKIADLSAAKITTGTLSADRIGANSITAAKIDSRGLTIRDARGNIILQSGSTPISAITSFLTIYRWDFPASLEGYTASGATATQVGDFVELAATTTDPLFRSPTALVINGALYNKIQVRIRRTAGTGWDGSVYYTTGSHGESGSFVKTIADGTSLNEWVVLEWDMAALTAGGSDWTSNTITRIRFDLGATTSDVFQIDWIAVGRYASGGPDQITADNATTFIANGAIKSAQIGDATITSAKIANSIQSDNYVAGAAGWQINRAGTAEFNSIALRGKITAGTTLATQVEVGANVASAGHHGISLSGENYNNCFIRREADGAVFFNLNSGGTNAMSFNTVSGILQVRGDIEATSIKANTVAVQTANIAGAAVTAMNYASGSSGYVTFGNTDYTVASTSLSMAAGSSGVVVIVTLNAIGVGGATMGLQILRNGSQLSYTAVSVLNGQTSSFVATGFDASPAAGSNTYTLNIVNQAPGGGDISYSAVTIVASGGKR